MFEVAPLVANLRTLVLEARPLKPTDAAAPDEAGDSASASLAVPPAQVAAARASVVQVRTAAAALQAVVTPLAQPATGFAAVVAGIDAAIAGFVDLQQAAGLCGVSLAGAGPVLAGRRDWFQLVRANAERVSRRWAGKLAACDALLADAANPASSNLMKIQALEKAEREISTSYTTPIPATPAPLLAAVTAKRATFAAAMAVVEAVRVSAAATIAPLWTAWQATFAGRPALDLTEDATAEEEARLRLLAEDMQRQVAGLLTELDRRLERADALIAEAATLGGQAKATALADAAKALLGDGFRIVPRFTLDSAQADEWDLAFGARAALTAHLAAAPSSRWTTGCTA